MISPHTPPGTPLVVTWVPSGWADLIRLLLPQYRIAAYLQTLHWCFDFALYHGQRVQLVAVVPDDALTDGFAAMIEGRGASKYSLKHFDVATLPSSITELLEGKPVDQDVVMPCDC